MSAVLGVSEPDLKRLGRIADRVLAGNPLISQGQRPRLARAGRGLEFLEHRPYREGDDLRNLDWRATARSRHPLVRNHQDEAFSTAFLCLDRSASMGAPTGTSWRLARQLTAALGYLVLHGGNRVGLLVFSGDIDLALAPSRGSSAYGSLVSGLASLEPRLSGGASRLEQCARRLPPGACAIVISDFLDPQFMRIGLDQLRRRGGRVQGLQVLDPALRFPGRPHSEAPPSRETAWGVGTETVLWDAESGERRTLHLTAEARDEAIANLDDLCSALRRHCLRRSIALTACPGDAAWQDVILEHLRSLSRRRSA